MELIDKSVLVAEIEKRIKEIDEIVTYLSPKDVLTNLLCHLNTLEVKEVDLEKEIQNIIHKHFYDYYGIVNSEAGKWANVNDMITVAKYFFQLGLRAKG